MSTVTLSTGDVERLLEALQTARGSYEEPGVPEPFPRLAALEEKLQGLVAGDTLLVYDGE